MKVSVIIPNYHRQHILKEIIPTYFQAEVKEVIEKLMKEFLKLKYYKLKKIQNKQWLKIQEQE